MQYPDGTRFVGKWNLDKKHGSGREYAADGSYADVEYENDLKISSGPVIKIEVIDGMKAINQSLKDKLAKWTLKA